VNRKVQNFIDLRGNSKQTAEIR